MNIGETILELRVMVKGTDGRYVDRSTTVTMSSVELVEVLNITGGVIFESRALCYVIKHKHLSGTKNLVWVERVDR